MEDLEKIKQLKEQARAKGYSILPCSFCGENFLARDYRMINPLCPDHARNKNSIDWAKKRYTNFQQGTLPDSVKEKLIKIRSGGPFFRPK